MNFMKQNIENINKRGIDLRDLGIDAYAYDYSAVTDLLRKHFTIGIESSVKYEKSCYNKR